MPSPQVYQWDKKKKKYVKANFNDLKARGGIKRKNEAGKDADLSKKQNLYAKWMDKTKLRIQEAGELVCPWLGRRISLPPPLTHNVVIRALYSVCWTKRWHDGQPQNQRR